ncbi:MAG TPA: ribonuclease HI [Bacteroidales bacterium]|jgi:ribonuclease HI|nr:ribonuclease HI [Bacteroidales bacterium]
MGSEITIYTDGAASGNPGPGGFGIVLTSGKHRLEKSQGFRLTTNNRMELLAVITALEALKIPGSRVVVYTDSRYVSDAVEKGWLFSWEAKAFKKKKNPDLWKRFLEVYRKHNVRFVWIKGHNNNKENELCDRLAVEAYRSGKLEEDTGYRPEENEDLLTDHGNERTEGTI